VKIAVSSTGTTLESQLDPRFGRTDYFIIIDADTMIFEALDNTAASSGGAGIAAAQAVLDKGVSVVITGSVGPNAMDVLKAAEITIYKGISETVSQNIEAYKKGELEKIETNVPLNSGMVLHRGNR
jgi:predicted Fe-Mo cluster-binding NifX family protein